MAWFRRTRRDPDEAPAASAPEGSATTSDLLPVPVASAASLERTERALRMLAVQSSQLHTHLVELEHRIDALSAGLLDNLDVPTYDDVLATRMHTAKVASELARLEVNVSSRLEAVLTEVRANRGTAPDIDLRPAAPTDTGWPAGAVR